ncbi:MAG: DUF3891 family protein [Gemmatimonadota bacterium]
MLVQKRHDGRLRLFRQHDHALVSGEAAAAWCGVGRDPESLPFELILATALHDVAWRPLDRSPRLDPETGLPVSFHEYPVAEKVEAYRRGLDRAARIHPYAGLLGSLHYSSFPETQPLEEFQSREEARRRDLAERLGLGPEDDAGIRTHLRYLQLFDTFSIVLCLTPPCASVETQPPWVDAARHLEAPAGGTFHLTWVDDEVLHVDPFPFRDTLELRVPYRELEGDRLGTADALSTAWESAPEERWWVSVRSALRLA